MTLFFDPFKMWIHFSPKVHSQLLRMTFSTFDPWAIIAT